VEEDRASFPRGARLRRGTHGFGAARTTAAGHFVARSDMGEALPLLARRRREDYPERMRVSLGSIIVTWKEEDRP
jgi:hypothetical protein